MSERSISQFLRGDEPIPTIDPVVQGGSDQRLSSECMMLIDSYHERYNKSGLLFGSNNSN